MHMLSYFFQLLRQADVAQPALTATPAPAEWKHLLQLARKQALTGVIYGVVSRLPRRQLPPREVLLEWFAESERIRRLNLLINKRTAEVTDLFRREGMRCVVLKGQGVALNYPVPQQRIPGDIDLWVETPRRVLIERLRKVFPRQAVVYHHMECPFFKDVAVEVHFIPSWLNRPVANLRLQRFFRRQSAGQFSNAPVLTESGATMNVPTDSFNCVYLLIHVYRHLFDEGVGLRQLMDYHYLLLHAHDKIDGKQVVTQLHRLGLYNFSRAVMFVLQHVFATPAEMLLTTPDPVRGRFLLHEIMLAGNFGHHDPRIRRRTNETRGERFVRKCKRNLRFLKHYPGETLCMPLFKMGHYAWRLYHGYL